MLVSLLFFAKETPWKAHCPSGMMTDAQHKNSLEENCFMKKSSKALQAKLPLCVKELKTNSSLFENSTVPCEQLVSPTISRERNHCEQPFDFPSSMCEVRYTPRDTFDITSS